MPVNSPSGNAVELHVAESGSFPTHWIRGRLASEIGGTSARVHRREKPGPAAPGATGLPSSSTARQGFRTNRPRCETPFMDFRNAPTLRGWAATTFSFRAHQGLDRSGFLVIAVAANERRAISDDVAVVLSEIILIGGWVALWRPLEIFMYDWWPIRADARLFDRLAAMPVCIAPDHADLPMPGRGIGRPPRPFLLAIPKDEPPHRSRVRSSGSRPARGLHRGSRSSAIARRPNGLYGLVDTSATRLGRAIIPCARQGPGNPVSTPCWIPGTPSRRACCWRRPRSAHSTCSITSGVRPIGHSAVRRLARSCRPRGPR